MSRIQRAGVPSMVERHSEPLGTLSADERVGLRDHVYNWLLELIVTGAIEAGTRLRIDKIAQDLDVSQSPVREALVHLEHTGLVIREHNRGYRVAPPLTDAEVEALFDARLILEGGAIRLAHAHRSSMLPSLRDALLAHEEVTHRLRDASSGGEVSAALFDEYFAIDWRFHSIIFKASNNPFVQDMTDSISTQVHRMRQMALGSVADAEGAAREHRAIVDALDCDADAAVAAMRWHIEHVRMRSLHVDRGDELAAG